jgi:two-component system, NtrC family, response regulator HydG
MSSSDPNPTTDEPTVIAESAAMRSVLELATRAAASDATVLIQGETGTGKEIVARLIHRESKRSAGPFVAVNCGAYTDSLLASELFGHVRGAFTGAVSDRPGVFEAASGGTVFLDEIGAMSPLMQVKVLRVLQERRVLRVGSSTEADVDARVVAATNADLAVMVREKEFREDLYYRVKVVSCPIPPLRDRRDDIEPLIDHYLTFFAQRGGGQGVSLTAEARAMLLGHPWPGNVRQLRSEIEQLVAMAHDGDAVGPERLSAEIRSPETLPTSDSPRVEQAVADNSPDASYQELLDAWTRRLVSERLARFGGNITKTAQSLAISRSTLYALLKKYGMHGVDD